MGCLYDLLGWGVIDAPEKVDADGYVIELAEMEESLWQGAVRDTYETEPPCLVIPLAISEPYLQEEWKLAPLPDWTPRVEPYRARVVAGPPTFVVPHAVQERWKEIQATYHRAGLVLPEAQLILLSDWD